MTKTVKRIWEYVLILSFCGYLYVCLELLFRQRSDVTMLFCASICAIPMLVLNEVYNYEMLFVYQVLICAVFSTIVEFIFGIIFNSDLHIWNYSNMPGNIMGQICPQFFLVWCGLSAIIIPFLDYIDYNLFGGEQIPYYRITDKITIWMKDRNEKVR